MLCIGFSGEVEIEVIFNGAFGIKGHRKDRETPLNYLGPFPVPENVPFLVGNMILESVMSMVYCNSMFVHYTLSWLKVPRISFTEMEPQLLEAWHHFVHEPKREIKWLLSLILVTAWSPNARKRLRWGISNCCEVIQMSQQELSFLGILVSSWTL